MESSLYVGWVKHRRFGLIPHEFKYRLFLVALDLTRLDEAFQDSWTWSTTHPAPAWFRRSDHIGDPHQALDESIRQLVEQSGRPRPSGKIVLLTHLRYWGLIFNPVSFYFCFNSAGEWETMVAEVSNTPWGQVHCYVVDRSALDRAQHSSDERIVTPKVFHVSPFLRMDYAYRWDIKLTEDRLVIHIENLPTQGCAVMQTSPVPQEQTAAINGVPPSADPTEAGDLADAETTGTRGNVNSCDAELPRFNVTLSLQQRPIDRWNRWRTLLGYPWMTASVMIGIYWQAWRLWRKRVRYVPHPGLRPTSVTIPHGKLGKVSVSD